MSPAELFRGKHHGFEPEGPSTWINDFHVEEGGMGEAGAVEVDSISPRADSKNLSRESAKLSNNDRLQIGIGRDLHFLRSRDILLLEYHGKFISGLEGRLLETGRNDSRPLKWLKRHSGLPAFFFRIAFEALRQAVASLRSHSSNDSHEVVLESFEGRVDQIKGDTAYVRLKSHEQGDVLYGKYPASQLLEKGIEEQGRFLCTTVKVNGTTRVDIQAIPSVPVTDEELRAIEEKIDRVLPRDDLGIEY